MDEEIATLMLAEVASTPPPGRFQVLTEPAFDWRPSVLAVGITLSARDRSTLERRGKVLQVETLQAGLAELHQARWDAVLVAPGLREESDGLRFVRAMKLALRVDELMLRVLSLRERYERTPFVVTPLPNDFEFAMFRTAASCFLGDARVTPLSYAVLHAVTPNWQP